MRISETLNSTLNSLNIELINTLTRFVLLCDGEGTSSAEHYQVQQRVSTQPVSTVDTGTCCLTTGIQATNNLVLSISMSDHLMGEKKKKHKKVCLFADGDAHSEDLKNK